MFFRPRHESQGFALPTVVITSVVMFAVLVAVFSLVSSTGTSLDKQYFQGLMADAAESGAQVAAACLGDNTMVLNAVVKPGTDCAGTAVSGQSAYVVNTSGYRTSFTAQLVSVTATTRTVKVIGKVERIRSSSNIVYSTNSVTRTLASSFIIDPNGDRPSQRFWYLGSRGRLDFGVSGSALPASTYNAASSSPSPTAAEGTTVVTDKNGNLQFWSNGITIWDRAGNVMQNSTGLNGAASATQAVASFPMNNARTKYAVISNSGQVETGPGEMYLSIVDMTLNSGFGAVTTKNQQLGTALDYTSEGIGAMPNNDGSGYYVYAYNSAAATITSFLIKTDGSVQGPFTTPMNPAPLICANIIGYGSFNFTKDYKRMVLLAGASRCGDTRTGTAYVFDTDAKTGALSLRSSWTTHSADTVVGHGNAGYTADFSPQEQYIYVTTLYPSSLTRYDIRDPSNVPASEWVVASPLTTSTDTKAQYQSGGQVRRGPDDRMYIADRTGYYLVHVGAPASTPSYVSYIANPDAPTTTTAAIGLNIDGITLASGSYSIWGLPQTATVFKTRVFLY